jgi:hypothetical protein
LILRGRAATPGVVPPAANPLQGPDADELLPLAVARPHEALARARAMLAAHPPPLAASIARQAIGIVLRDRGDTAEAIEELRRALRLARAAGSTAREADVLATLGAALVFGGRPVAGGRAQGTEGVEIRRARGPNLRVITLNGTSPVLSDVNVRQALAKAIDRQIIADALIGPLGGDPTKLDNHIFVPNQQGYRDNAGDLSEPDVGAANAQLDQAGWTRQGGGIRTVRSWSSASSSPPLSPSVRRRRSWSRACSRRWELG